MTLAAVVLAVLAVVAVLVWTVAIVQHAAQQIDSTCDIKPPVYRFRGYDEALAVRTRKRREAADAIHTRAHKVESGTS